MSNIFFQLSWQTQLKTNTYAHIGYTPPRETTLLAASFQWPMIFSQHPISPLIGWNTPKRHRKQQRLHCNSHLRLKNRKNWYSFHTVYPVTEIKLVIASHCIPMNKLTSVCKNWKKKNWKLFILWYRTRTFNTLCKQDPNSHKNVTENRSTKITEIKDSCAKYDKKSQKKKLQTTIYSTFIKWTTFTK